MEILDLIKSTILPIIDVILVAIMLYYAYKLVRGTAAIIVFRGFVIIYIIWSAATPICGDGDPSS